MSPITVRMSRPDEWREARDLRLEMLADTPIAFGDTLATARGYSESEWIARAKRMTRSGSCSAVAVSEEGRWVGTMGAFVGNDGRAALVTVYLTPDHRGRELGVADRLLGFVEDWVRETTDAAELTLDVHADNAVAIAFYRRHGFEPTGAAHPYPLDRTKRELQFAKALRAVPLVE